jgi:hypothetical protein
LQSSLENFLSYIIVHTEGWWSHVQRAAKLPRRFSANSALSLCRRLVASSLHRFVVSSFFFNDFNTFFEMR